MSAVNPPTETKQQPAAAFEVDFEGVRDTFQDSGSSGGGALSMRSVAGAGAAALAPLVMGAAEASAKGGEFGIIEGKTASFFHPIIMVRVMVYIFRCVVCVQLTVFIYVACYTYVDAESCLCVWMF